MLAIGFAAALLLALTGRGSIALCGRGEPFAPFALVPVQFMP